MLHRPGCCSLGELRPGTWGVSFELPCCARCPQSPSLRPSQPTLPKPLLLPGALPRTWSRSEPVTIQKSDQSSHQKESELGERIISYPAMNDEPAIRLGLVLGNLWESENFLGSHFFLISYRYCIYISGTNK